jgi:hypothetical protein
VRRPPSHSWFTPRTPRHHGQRVFPAASLGKVTDLVNQICTKYSLEYAFDPGLSSANAPIVTLRIGTAATMGRPYAPPASS